MNFNIIYIIGFILVLMYFAMGIDDFIWDIVSIFKRASYRKRRLNLHDVDKIPPKVLAVAIAAWHESNVIGDVVDNFIESTQYPKSMYHIFLGVYPNDEFTVVAAKALSQKYSNVHTIINDIPGPTSKAQNLNYVIKQIKNFEEEKGWRFASLTIHDSEDVVHPYELKVTNYLIDKYPALQFPVFPLMQKPRFKNFFRNLTTSTYADEFAENHFTTMVSRCNSGAFVPSAGTGFVLSRETIKSFGDNDVLPSNSLTEDYRLSLTLYEKGINIFYVLERVPRITDDNKLVWDFITTRSIFPNTFQTAIKQKTRWILGITMQSFKLMDIFQMKGLKIVGRYSLYKDLKAKVGNLLNLFGYPVLIYFILSLFLPLTPIYPIHSLSWYLSSVITVMMIERQIFRGVAIYNVYGLRSVFFSCLLPPILPIRFVWGNVINFVATIKAYKQNIFGKNTRNGKEEKRKTNAKIKTAAKLSQKQKGFAWSKTDHAFLEKSILRRYHRKLGDILLEKGYIPISTLQAALKDNKERNQNIGNYLLERGLISEQQLLNALSCVKHIQYINVDSLDNYESTIYAEKFEKSMLYELLTIPILKTSTGYVFAFCDDSPIDAQTFLREQYGITVNPVFASRQVIESGIEKMYTHQKKNNSTSDILKLFKDGRISYEQAIIARNYVGKSISNSEIETLEYMGLAIKQMANEEKISV